MQTEINPLFILEIIGHIDVKSYWLSKTESISTYDMEVIHK